MRFAISPGLIRGVSIAAAALAGACGIALLWSHRGQDHDAVFPPASPFESGPSGAREETAPASPVERPPADAREETPESHESRDAPGQSKGAPTTPGTSLLLVTVDTVRADRLGCYGSSAAASRALDRLAAEGAVVDQAWAVAPLTLPSHASILTSRTPPSHGVRDNADYRLPASELTLAEHLRAHGYATAAAVGSIVLDSRLGLAQGFTVYDELPRFSGNGAGGVRIATQEIIERPATEVTAAALRALDRIPPGPFFLWAHYFDPHQDYAPPPGWAHRFPGRPYEGEIAYMDSEIGRLVAAVRRARDDGPLLTVVAGDHGESLGDHGESTHGLFVYESTLRIPLILKLPGVIPEMTRVTRLVSAIDIAPTCLDLMGLPPLPRAQGESFARCARGEPMPPRAIAYAESLFAARVYGWSPLVALRSLDRKFILASEPELYDLEADPAEASNLAAIDASTVSAWSSSLDALVSGFTEPDPAAEAASDEEQRERLASLGYLPAALSLRPRADRSDPRERATLHERILDAQALVLVGRIDEAVRAVQGVLKADPDNPAALSLQGTVQFSRGESEAGLTGLEQAARAAPLVYENQRNLANALHAAGRLQDAERAYRRGVAIRPDAGDARYGLGNVLFALGKKSDAVSSYRDAIRLGPDAPTVRAALGVALSSLGRPDEARQELRRAVQADPSLTGAWVALGDLDGAASLWPAARESYDRALSHDPLHPRALLGLSLCDLRLGRFPEAALHARAFLQHHPRHPAVPFARGLALMAEGDREGARSAMGEYLGGGRVEEAYRQTALSVHGGSELVGRE